jgi:hypothetical protein
MSTGAGRPPNLFYCGCKKCLRKHSRSGRDLWISEKTWYCHKDCHDEEIRLRLIPAPVGARAEPPHKPRNFHANNRHATSNNANPPTRSSEPTRHSSTQHHQSTSQSTSHTQTHAQSQTYENVGRNNTNVCLYLCLTLCWNVLTVIKGQQASRSAYRGYGQVFNASAFDVRYLQSL